jgi:hypothetical protein
VKSRMRALLALSFALAFVAGVAGVADAAGKADLAAVRQATDRYHDLSAALADGYVEFYVCTEQPGVGTMGQHYVNLSLAGDPAVDPLRPEVLVYAPKRNGGLKLVGVEYVTFDTASQPSVLGQPMLFRPAGNRYGLPDFYEMHAWIWKDNPLGMHNDWNPTVTCAYA